MERNPQPESLEADIQKRRHWMGILAQANREELERALKKIKPLPSYRFLRPPEIGLIMVRGRAGGTGNPFNLGEMTMTRCTVQTGKGYVGCGYVAGRDLRHAALAALMDALLQDEENQERMKQEIIGPMEAARKREKMEEKRKVDQTRVEFFTMVRGEG